MATSSTKNNNVTTPEAAAAASPPVVLLSPEEGEDDDDEVRQLAASLAPQVQELDALLASPPPTIDSPAHDSSQRNDSDDDGLLSEEKQLETSQQLLRQELEFAQDWSQLMASPLKEDSVARQLASSFGVEQQQHEEERHHSYTITNHAETLGLEVDGGWYIVPTKLHPTMLEYVVPLPMEQLKRLYIGLAGVTTVEGDATPAEEEEEAPPPDTPASTTATTPRTTTTTPSTSSTTSKRRPSRITEPLPVRTVVIWIRPDVLCGAVMDALHHALEHMGGEMTKRQGGHLRGVVASCISGEGIMMPPYVVDAQLCTYKGTSPHNKQGQRTLILRVYHHVCMDEDAEGAGDTTIQQEEMQESSNLLLKEAAALVQKMESGGGSTEMSKRSSLVSLFSPSKTEEVEQEVISDQLLQTYKPCPSVQEGRLTLPALSRQDYPVIHASWRWMEACWNELETRDLCYSSLDTCQFGAFPALPTLDVQYCSQLRRLSREGMIISLLKSASDLEEYAREAEYACANLIQMLRPSFEHYGIEPPALPQPLPLTAYPLDFLSPQTSCPPWGMKVMEALNKVSVMTIDDENTQQSYEMSDTAIDMVLKAFQQQDDEEQGARLGRKNVQVMDRLAKMQAHKRASIASIRGSYGRNFQVVQAADDFHCRAQQACPEDDEKSPEDQVPLYKCSVLVRSSTGTCYITATQILFVTQFIPIVGGQMCTLFNMDEGLEFTLSEGSSSLLNPLPTSISISKDGQEVYSFRPSHSAGRLVTFLKVVQAMATTEDGGELTFSDRGGLLYMYGDTPPRRQ